MNTKRAFTLVELLTVIVIISILATLVTVAVTAAMRAAKIAKIGMQMNQINMALDRYKAEFGEYPPDMFDDEALVRHVKKRWPRYVFTDATEIRIAIGAAYGNGVDFTKPGSEIGSLALWLGGFPNVDGKLSGFSADPENPFTPNGAFDKKTFLDLEWGADKNVRIEGYGVPVIGGEMKGVFVPIVYFKGKTDGGPDAYLIGDLPKLFDFSPLGLGICVPYIEEMNETTGIKWKNSSTFQLIHPGLDGKFGASTERIIKPGTGIGAADWDNITNFSDCKELQSILP